MLVASALPPPLPSLTMLATPRQSSEPRLQFAHRPAALVAAALVPAAVRAVAVALVAAAAARPSL
eukprot:1564893-Rhodomonas_salina.1